MSDTPTATDTLDDSPRDVKRLIELMAFMRAKGRVDAGSASAKRNGMIEGNVALAVIGAMAPWAIPTGRIASTRWTRCHATYCGRWMIARGWPSC